LYFVYNLAPTDAHASVGKVGVIILYNNLNSVVRVLQTSPSAGKMRKRNLRGRPGGLPPTNLNYFNRNGIPAVFCYHYKKTGLEKSSYS